MYKINRFRKTMAAAALAMVCVLAAGNGVGATTTNKTASGTTSAGTTTTKDTASADNSLKSLKLSEGTLSPAFVYNTVKYSATVSADTTSIDVNAVVSDPGATVQSVSGNTDLKEGANTVKVVVAAENGNQATYTITVTREAQGVSSDDSASASQTDENSNDEKAENTDTAENTETAAVSGADGYTVADSIPSSVIPEDFTETEVTYQDATCKALKFDKSDVVLLYMVDASSNGALFVYDQTAGTVYPFIEISNGEKYIILLQAPAEQALGDSYAAAELTIDGKSVTEAYQTGDEDTADFYIFYAVNSEGTGSWYQYDTTEGTYQRYVESGTGDVTASEDYQYLQNSYKDLNDKYTSLKDKDTKFIAGLIIALAVFLIVIVNLLLRGRGNTEEPEQTDEIVEADAPVKNAGADRKKQKKAKEPEVREQEPDESPEKYTDREDAAADFEEEPDLFGGRKHKKEKKKKWKREDIFDKQDEKEEDYYDDEEPLEEKKKGSSLDDDLEILDLNDL